MLPNTFLYIQSLIQINRVKGKFNYFWKFVLQPLNGVPAVLCMWLQFNSFWDSFIFHNKHKCVSARTKPAKLSI